MTAEALFGDGPDRDEFEGLAAERAQDEPVTEDLITPTLSLMVCPVTITLTYAYEC